MPSTHEKFSVLHSTAAQRETAVAAYLESNQLLLFVFSQQLVCLYSMAEENPAAQRHTAVAVY